MMIQTEALELSLFGSCVHSCPKEKAGIQCLSTWVVCYPQTVWLRLSKGELITTVILPGKLQCAAWRTMGLIVGQTLD